jgi:hypothetical protein
MNFELPKPRKMPTGITMQANTQIPLIEAIKNKLELPPHLMQPVVESDFLNSSATGLTFGAIGGGTTSTSSSEVNGHRNGVLGFNSSTTVGSGYSIGTNTSPLQLLGGEVYESIIEWADTRTTALMVSGFRSNASASEPINGAYGLMTGNATGALLQAVTSKNSVRTIAPTSFQMLKDVWYRLKVEVNLGGGSVTYSLFNSPDAGATPLWKQTITSNVPILGDGVGFGMFAWNTGTTAGLIANIDWMRYSCSRLLNR